VSEYVERIIESRVLCGSVSNFFAKKQLYSFLFAVKWQASGPIRIVMISVMIKVWNSTGSRRWVCLRLCQQSIVAFVIREGRLSAGRLFGERGACAAPSIGIKRQQLSFRRDSARRLGHSPFHDKGRTDGTVTAIVKAV